MPPDALTPNCGPTVARINLTSAIVAPLVLKPVEVLTKCAPLSTTILQARIFSSSVSRQVSKITFTVRSSAASTTSISSRKTYLSSPAFSRPMFRTTSISCAPSSIAASASNRFVSPDIAPSGKPTTPATFTSEPSSKCCALAIHEPLTQTLKKLFSRASAQSFSMSSALASGLSKVWSIKDASCTGERVCDI